MGKARKSKRELVRDEKRKRKRDIAVANVHAKRQRVEDAERETNDDLPTFDEADDGQRPGIPEAANGPEREFFGHLTDEEQEYFRHADELLELNDFPTPDDRAIFIENVFREAQGKELKLASSQSCSRLMERLVMLSTVPQKKHLFGAFTGHFMTLVTHRFASHCCEQLFIQSAPTVSAELGVSFPPILQDGEGNGEKQGAAMEDLFLLALDEFEEHLTTLLTDRFASHTLRVILLVLSGRPLDQASTKSMVQSKKKERITVPGAAAVNDTQSQVRVVPESFALATEKIIVDSTSSMDATALRVLATHPTGNPTMQLLLDLDIAINTKSRGDSAKEKSASDGTTLLGRLLPGAPASLANPESDASVFVKSMLYDPIGSRLLETIIAHCPGKIFKALNSNILGPRIETFLRNDIASYPAIKLLNRLSKDDLVAAVRRILPTVPGLVDKGRFNVLKTLFERCHARGAEAEIDALLAALQEACGCDASGLVAKLCLPDDGPPEDVPEEEQFQQFPTKKPAAASHACYLLASLVLIPGAAAFAVQTSLVALSEDQTLRLATASTPTSHLLTTALPTPTRIAGFHRRLVAPLLPHAVALAASPAGHNVLNAAVAAPLPLHLKEAAMGRLAAVESELREQWSGRSVWRTWRGDLWKRRREEWRYWAKEAGGVVEKGR